MSTAKDLQDALVYAIESAMRETLPMGIRPEVVFMHADDLEVGVVQILIRSGMRCPSAQAKSPELPSESAQLPAAPAACQHTHVTVESGRRRCFACGPLPLIDCACCGEVGLGEIPHECRGRRADKELRLHHD